jgi:hypothetical protein
VNSPVCYSGVHCGGIIISEQVGSSFSSRNIRPPQESGISLNLCFFTNSFVILSEKYLCVSFCSFPDSDINVTEENC